MGLSHRRKVNKRIPLRLDRIAKDMCKCDCHGEETPNPHRGMHCPCNSNYRVDGNASNVVHCIQEATQ